MTDDKLDKISLFKGKLLMETAHYKKISVGHLITISCGCDNPSPVIALKESGYCETCYDSWKIILCANCKKTEFDVVTCKLCGCIVNKRTTAYEELNDYRCSCGMRIPEINYDDAKIVLNNRDNILYDNNKLEE